MSRHHHNPQVSCAGKHGKLVSGLKCDDKKEVKIHIDLDVEEKRHPIPRPCDNGNDNERATYEISRRFAGFQRATSRLKDYGHDPDPTVFPVLLTDFLSYINPNFTSYSFITAGTIFNFPTLADIATAYTFFAQVLFNSYSQHFFTDIIVDLDPASCGKRAHMVCDGGEYANIFTDLTTSPPSVPMLQDTWSSWDITWIKKDGVWYVDIYTEFGNEIIHTDPVTGLTFLVFQRLYPGATPTPLGPPVAAAIKSQAKVKEVLARYIKKP